MVSHIGSGSPAIRTRPTSSGVKWMRNTSAPKLPSSKHSRRGVYPAGARPEPSDYDKEPYGLICRTDGRASPRAASTIRAVRICTPDNGISDKDRLPSTRLVADPAQRQSPSGGGRDKTFNLTLK
ncbi:hypothetical protein Aab01nite_10350 [Paractinoplanes abujensis]|nr:hypothetical protein Aab01nite_10350 [Actinoplanes abujensis]